MVIAIFLKKRLPSISVCIENIVNFIRVYPGKYKDIIAMFEFI